MRVRGFTLIELLIVIAIILILIAIALPNFLEAQVRAKVTKAKAEERSLGTAMEEYFLDWGNYPSDYDNSPGDQLGMFQLTTPIKLIADLPEDPFNQRGTGTEGDEPGFYEMASSSRNPLELMIDRPENQDGLYPKRRHIHAYIIFSAGPDGGEDFDDNDAWPWPGGNTNQCPSGMGGINYAPTNGTKSNGDIMFFGGAWRSGRWCLDEWQDIQGAGWERKF